MTDFVLSVRFVNGDDVEVSRVQLISPLNRKKCERGSSEIIATELTYEKCTVTKTVFTECTGNMVDDNKKDVTWNLEVGIQGCGIAIMDEISFAYLWPE